MEISGRQEKLETESDVEREMTLLAIASILAVSSLDCEISKASNNKFKWQKPPERWGHCEV